MRVSTPFRGAFFLLWALPSRCRRDDGLHDVVVEVGFGFKSGRSISWKYTVFDILKSSTCMCGIAEVGLRSWLLPACAPSQHVLSVFNGMRYTQALKVWSTSKLNDTIFGQSMATSTQFTNGQSLGSQKRLHGAHRIDVLDTSCDRDLFRRTLCNMYVLRTLKLRRKPARSTTACRARPRQASLLIVPNSSQCKFGSASRASCDYYCMPFRTHRAFALRALELRAFKAPSLTVR